MVKSSVRRCLFDFLRKESPVSALRNSQEILYQDVPVQQDLVSLMFLNIKYN